MEEGEKAMNALIAMSKSDPKIMNAIAIELAAFTGIDDPSTWTPDVLLKALRNAKEQRQADVVNRRIELAGIVWQDELTTFLNYTRSPHTKRAYASAMRDFQNWTSRKGINPLELSPASADSFIHDLKAQGKASASVRRDVAAICIFRPQRASSPEK